MCTRQKIIVSKWEFLTVREKNGILLVYNLKNTEASMNKLTKILLSLLLIAAVMGYTVYNYLTGKTDMFSFLVFAAILGIPFVNMINILIQELKNR